MKDDHTENDPFEEDELFRSHDNFHVLSPEEIEKQNRDKGIIATYGGNRENRYGNSPLINVGVKINGEDHFKETSIQLELKQFLNAGHEFTLRADPDEFGEGNANLLEHSRKHLGSRISFFFNQYGKTASTFTGIITRISTRKEEGISYVFIEGKSPSILMEDGLNCRSFENKTFEEIINEVIKDYPKNLISYHINPEHKEKLPYTVQYMESDFAFLQRLFSRYGEYHYYNGESFCLSPFGGRITELMEGEDIYNYGLQLELKPQNFSYTAYEPKQGKTNTLNSKDKQIQQSENPFQQFAKNVSENTFSTSPTIHYSNSLLPNGTRDLQKAVEREQKKRQNLVYMEAATNNPSLRIGDVAKMMIHIPGHRIFKNGRVPVESYKIISLIHRFADGEGYSNTFVGVPKDLTVPDNYNPNDHPRAEVQHAIVTDNKDPLKMGRIRIKFPWQEQDNQQTPWVQVLQPHAGQGKGTYMNPEIGESVLCAFQGGNAEAPVVLGTAYNGSEIAAYYTEGNDIKVIQTRSGTKIIFNDADKSILVADPSGNSVLLDGEGNIKVKAPNNIELKAGNDINMEAGNNFNLRVGNQTRLDSFTSIQMTTPVLKQNISDYFRSQSNTALISTSKEMKLESQNIDVAGKQNLFLHSDNRATVNSKGVAEMRGELQNSFDNSPESYELQPQEVISYARVEFRTLQPRYAGEFGFDYYRRKDYNLTLEAPFSEGLLDTWHSKEEAKAYEKIPIKETMKKRKENALKKLKGEYEQIPVKGEPNEEDLTYYVPYLTLFSQEFVNTLSLIPLPCYEAELRILVNIWEEVDRLEFEYDTSLFTLNKTILKDKEKTTKLVSSQDKTVKITCTKELTEDKYICIYAYPKGCEGKSKTEQQELRTLAGKIKILANDEKRRRSLKMALIGTEVIVIDNNGKEKEQEGTFSEEETAFLHRVLYQALILPEIEEIPLFNLKGKKEFRKGGKYIDKNGKLTRCFQELWELFVSHPGNGKYEKYFTVFAFGIPSTPSTFVMISAGEAQGAGIQNAVLFPGRDASTLPHEVLHGLGLRHIHMEIADTYIPVGQPERKYAFVHNRVNAMRATDNVMAYTTRAKVSWHWQWEIIWKNIDAGSGYNKRDKK